MSGSALLGHAPMSDGVRLIYRALLIISPSTINADKTDPLGPSAPATATNHRHGSGMIIGSSVAIALVLLITCARIGFRKYRSHALGGDDVVMIPAAIGCIMYLALNIASESRGCLGQHLNDCKSVEVDRFIRLSRANLPMFYFTVFCVKFSITLANLRITGLTSYKWLYGHWAFLAILACLMPICVFITTFSCSPIVAMSSPQYTGTIGTPRTTVCLDEDAVGHFTRIAHVVTDWLLLPVPLIVVRRLRMPLARKVRLMFVFCIGLMSSVASIVRIILSQRVTTDLTYDYYELYAWDVVDISFATIVASLPALNGPVELAVLKLKSWGSLTAARLLGKFRSVGDGSRALQHYDTQLSDKESNEAVSLEVINDRSWNRFYSYRESFFGLEENIQYGVHPSKPISPAAHEVL